MAEETKPRTRHRRSADEETAPEQHASVALADVIPARELAPGLEHNSSDDPCPPYAVA